MQLMNRRAPNEAPPPPRLVGPYHEHLGSNEHHERRSDPWCTAPQRGEPQHPHERDGMP